ncbi:hypothetical protein F1643_05920 [Azospirillum sp. INR13]|uniref:hypothetical protein n=1 Tax=Azospirillum sp. INR13 TaxID=2596919 RepID=UPI0018921708|nr:hypothetical protein [Azospirillum sp. INR13]MBF5094093.1 hypothetical protein [Azospirillum sp. INR13]
MGRRDAMGPTGMGMKARGIQACGALLLAGLLLAGCSVGRINSRDFAQPGATLPAGATVAVLPFENLTNHPNAGQIAADLVSTELYGVGNVRHGGGRPRPQPPVGPEVHRRGCGNGNRNFRRCPARRAGRRPGAGGGRGAGR